MRNNFARIFFWLLIVFGGVAEIWADEASEALQNRWSAVDFGLSSDESVDNTEALQTALNQAGKAGGGVVELPSGRFSVRGTLSIPAGVTLRGTYHIAPTMINSAQAATGTTLLAYAGRGSQDGEPFIRLAGDNSVVQGIAVIYPEWKQSDVPPVPYPPCIEAESATNVGILDCCLLNPYEGIKLVNAARHLVRNVTGYPIKRGLFVDECYDIGHIENIHFWPFGVLYQPQDPYCQWINLEGVAFEFARTDWHYVMNTFCFGYGVGYKFSEVRSGGTNGNFLGIGADSCRRAVLVEQAQKQGLLITNGEFVGRWSSEDSICLEILEQCGGKVSLNNCAFWGPIQTCILMKSPTGQLTANACHFVNWDEVHSRRTDQQTPAIQLDAGKTIVQGSTFEKQGTHVLVGENVRSVICQGNQALGGFRAEGAISWRVQLQGNEPNAMDLVPNVKEWYSIDVGAPGDESFLTGWYQPEKRGDDFQYRWTTDDSRVTLPVVPQQKYEIQMELNVPEFAMLENDEAGVYYQGKNVAPLQVGAQKITFSIETLQDREVLEIRCRSWVPAEAIAESGDPRSIGVDVSSIEVKKIGTTVAAPLDANELLRAEK